MPDLGGPVVSHAFVDEGKVRRSGDRYWRRRIGWRAFRAGVVVVEQQRALRPRVDGAFEPMAPWSAPTFTIYRAAAAPRRRVGDVPTDPAGPDGTAPGGGQNADTDHLPDLTYLPARVRAGFVAAVSRPVISQAQALRHTRQDGTAYFTVDAIRIGSRCAVVLTAAHQEESRSWQTEQVTYELAQDVGGLETGRERRQVGDR